MWLQPIFSLGNFDMKSDIPCENIFDTKIWFFSGLKVRIQLRHTDQSSARHGVFKLWLWTNSTKLATDCINIHTIANNTGNSLQETKLLTKIGVKYFSF